jgi:membrane protein
MNSSVLALLKRLSFIMLAYNIIFSITEESFWLDWRYVKNREYKYRLSLFSISFSTIQIQFLSWALYGEHDFSIIRFKRIESLPEFTFSNEQGDRAYNNFYNYYRCYCYNSNIIFHSNSLSRLLVELDSRLNRVMNKINTYIAVFVAVTPILIGIINWDYIIYMLHLSIERHILDISVFFVIIILWRVINLFVGVYSYISVKSYNGFDYTWLESQSDKQFAWLWQLKYTYESFRRYTDLVVNYLLVIERFVIISIFIYIGVFLFSIFNDIPFFKY